MKTDTKAAQIVTALAGTHEGYEPPDIDQRVAAWAGGLADADVEWWLGMAEMVVEQPLAGELYLAHVAWVDRSFPAIKEWGYRVAVDFVGAKGSGERARSLVERYRVDWGHQAARDGIALALWGEQDVPGIVARADRFKCGKQAYQRVRTTVADRTADQLATFRHALRWARGELRDRDLEEAWEIKTGASWASA